MKKEKRHSLSLLHDIYKMQWHMVSTKFIIKIGHAHNHPIVDSWPENYMVKRRV